MLTKTKTIHEKRNDLETNHSFSIPENIKKDINEKWFHLYEWIWEQDVKQSIERDFLKLITKLWTFFSLTLIIPSIILLYIEAYLIFNFYFFWLLWIINIFLTIYLVWISIKRSNILKDNNQVLITDTSVSINWKIKKLESNKITSNYNLNNISNIFEEKLFWESHIHKSKKSFKDQVVKQITNWYAKIWSMWRWRNWAQLMLLLWALYSVYALSLWFIYLFWIFFIWIFWNILSVINKKLLLISWHEITTINNYFENIDKDSKSLIIEKETLTTLLNQAMESNWKDSLLIKINSWIKDINKNASDAVNTSIKLRKKIESSKYHEMFNFSIYNSWIKKQIYIPLQQISDLLNVNLEKLKKNKETIEKQILETTDQSLQWPLFASKTRTIMRIEDVEKHINSINVYIEKLK